MTKKEIKLTDVNINPENFYHIPFLHNGIISTAQVKPKKAEAILKTDTEYVIKEQVYFDFYYEKKMPSFFKKNEKKNPFILESDNPLPPFLFCESAEEAIIKYSWIITNSLETDREEKIIAQTKLYEMSLRKKELVETIVRQEIPIVPFIEFDILNQIAKIQEENR